MGLEFVSNISALGKMGFGFLSISGLVVVDISYTHVVSLLPLGSWPSWFLVYFGFFVSSLFLQLKTINNSCITMITSLLGLAIMVLV